tara:strand:+ start:131 stop:385 length:255 start_codon:yes stop_codon:yes gene_type:complete
MAYKPKNKVQDEILDVIKNKTTVKTGIANTVGGHKLPDPKEHQRISFIKSGIRIAGYGLLFYSIPIAASVLVLSEVVGIYEELV